VYKAGNFGTTIDELGWRQNNGNRSNQESKFDFLLATCQCLVKIDEAQQKIKIVCQPPANEFSPSPGTTLQRNSGGGGGMGKKDSARWIPGWSPTPVLTPPGVA